MLTWSEVKNKKEVQKIEKGYIYAAFTDCLHILKWPLSKEEEAIMEQSFRKMLECRIFNEKMEYRMIRSDIKRNWKIRFIEDETTEEDTEQYYTEKQYLDIDSTQTKGTEKGLMITTTRGGKILLPVIYSAPYPQDIKIKIRNYISYYEETGQAYVKDWRICGFNSAGNQK